MKKNFDRRDTEESLEVLVDALYPDPSGGYMGKCVYVCICIYMQKFI